MSGSERTLHLHIGLPKTASTWLQREVLPALDHLRVVEKPRTRLFRQPKDAAKGFGTFDCALRRSATLWDARGDALFEEMLGPRERWRAEARSLLVTDEGIGRAASRPALLAAHLDGIRATAERWGLPRLRVLCLIRRQDHWLASHYAQISDRARRPGQAGFEAMVAQVLDPARSRYELGALVDFDALSQALVPAIGTNGLLILPQEALRDEPEAMLGQILAWLGTPEPRRADIAAAALGRQANVRSRDDTWRLRPPSFRVPGRARRLTLPDWAALGGGRTIALRPEISAAILAAYGPGNRRLAAAAGLPLDRWGYFEAPAAAAEPPPEAG